MDNPNPPEVGKVAFNSTDVVGKVSFDKTCSCHSTGLDHNYIISSGEAFVPKQEPFSKSPFEEMSASETLLYCKFRKAELEVTVNAAEDKVLAIYDNCGGEFTFDKKPITKALLEAIITIDDFFKP